MSTVESPAPVRPYARRRPPVPATTTGPAAAEHALSQQQHQICSQFRDIAEVRINRPTTPPLTKPRPTTTTTTTLHHHDAPPPGAPPPPPPPPPALHHQPSQ